MSKIRSGKQILYLLMKIHLMFGWTFYTKNIFLHPKATYVYSLYIRSLYIFNPKKKLASSEREACGPDPPERSSPQSGISPLSKELVLCVDIASAA